ncbi:MAG: bifunctional adenosylcobinamide kinase/adenosylcobinamide-phosphate guanylyltransferase [Bacteroidales bacterium]|jgi:adenosylcobinamide kinase/adenosylcobinamide-phosphate guanylyltransferase|nr:bifunctional adenosylcobinamide kinase/adenosylcobinamide-phosphate guanylyltransferase [Bacteroidales bacterium]
MIHFITGGQRSGKSSYAEKIALEASPHPVYLATSRIWDKDFAQRVKRHQEGRGKQWENVEKEVAISDFDATGRVVVIDCVTLWLTNIFFDNNESSIDEILALAKDEFDKFIDNDAHYIFISNEIGMGGHAANEVGRKFTDLQGWMNQYIAQKADSVTLMVSGIPVSVK